MKMPGKVRSMIDEMEGLSSSDKAKLVRHLNDMADSLPEHPTPAEATRIVKGALKSLDIKVGKKEKAEEPKEEPKKEKKEKKEEVKESIGAGKMSFKAFLMEFSKGDFDANLSMKAAQKIQALLDTRFRGYFDHKPNKDGSVTFKQNGGTHEHDEGNSYVLSPQNLSKLIGKTMDKFRKLGWTFTQPAMKEFIIGVPEGENLANMGNLSEGMAINKPPMPYREIIRLIDTSTMPQHVTDVLRDAGKELGYGPTRTLNGEQVKGLCTKAGLRKNDTQEVLDLVGFYNTKA